MTCGGDQAPSQTRRSPPTPLGRRRLKNAKLRNNACLEEIDYRTARGLDKNVIRALVQESA